MIIIFMQNLLFNHYTVDTYKRRNNNKRDRNKHKQSSFGLRRPNTLIYLNIYK